MHRFVLLLVIACHCLSCFAQPALPAPIDAIEFYNANLDHYFITVMPDEIANLDQGKVDGWQRTGGKFTVGAPTVALVGGAKVCRFYGTPAAGIDSHYYVATTGDCHAIEAEIGSAWQLETDNAFQVYQPDAASGRCPANTTPLYRSWNQRKDSNHRYTTDYSVQQAMIAKGSVAEGQGDPAVAMCALLANDAHLSANDVPSCTLAATASYPALGDTVTLSATCTASPSLYAWSESTCTSIASSCTVSSATAGVRSYTVQARNAAGSAAPAATTVNWQSQASASAAGPDPSAGASSSCTLFASTMTPQVGVDLILTAACTGNPSAYVWKGCSSTGPSCRTQETSAGDKTYSIAATTTTGTGTATTLTLTWSAGSSTPPPSPGNAIGCALSASSTAPTVGDTITLTATCTGAPDGYSWTNCASAGATCAISAAQAGSVTYGVRATRVGAADATATVDVNWQAAATAPPSTSGITCTLSAASTTPVLGTTLALTANCSGAPQSFAWTNCIATGAICTATALTAGVAAYSVVASANGVASAPASLSVNWQAVAPPPPTSGGDMCSAYGTDVTRVDVPFASTVVHSRDVSPGFSPGGIWVIGFTVPADATGTTTGRVSVAEYGDPPTMRDVTLSAVPCDFRSAVDATGQAAPLAHAAGNTATILLGFQPAVGVVALIPGRTYYFNVRNWSADLQAVSCTGSCNALVELSPPR